MPGSLLDTRRWAVAIRALAFLLLVGSLGAAAAPTLIPGSRISLEVPAGFSVARGYAGIAQADARVSVRIAELPTAARQMRAAMTAEQLASRGMRLVETEPVVTPIGEGTLLLVAQQDQGVEFRRLILVTGNEGETVLLTASAPASAWPTYADTLRGLLLGARWDPLASVDPMAALGFRIGATADLEPALALAGAALLVTSRDPADAPESGGPFALVTRSATLGEGRDLAAISRRQLAASRRITDARIGRERETEMGGMPAHELIASARSNGKELTVYQVLGFDGDSYYLLQGFVETARDARFVPQFRALADSLEISR